MHCWLSPASFSFCFFLGVNFRWAGNSSATLDSQQGWQWWRILFFFCSFWWGRIFLFSRSFVVLALPRALFSLCVVTSNFSTLATFVECLGKLRNEISHFMKNFHSWLLWREKLLSSSSFHPVTAAARQSTSSSAFVCVIILHRSFQHSLSSRRRTRRRKKVETESNLLQWKLFPSPTLDNGANCTLLCAAAEN